MRKIALFGSILICFMLVIAVLMPPVSSSYDLSNISKENNEIPEGLWFIRGTFKYFDEDEEYIYLKAISSKLRGFGNGVAVYHLFFCSIKISKPFYGFLPAGLFPLPGFGLCRQWDYHDMVTNDKLENGPDLQVGVFGGSILNGFRRVGGVIYNNGDESVYDIAYTLSIKGGYDNSIDIIKSGNYGELIPTQSLITLTNEVHGFGLVTISVSATSTNAGSSEDSIIGFQIGPYTISQPYVIAWF